MATDRDPTAEELAELDAYAMAATVDFGVDAKQELLDLRSENARLRAGPPVPRGDQAARPGRARPRARPVQRQDRAALTPAVPTAERPEFASSSGGARPRSASQTPAPG